MIKHVVMWKFRAGEEAAMREFLAKLQGLKGVIEQIVDQEVGINCNEKGNFDAVLISTFRSMAELEAYQTDPRHVAVSSLCKAIRTERASVDFEF